ncbi:Nif3-like dinuclear metal center hexameric protein [Candidatus Acidulodesulfobacterium sp. H_13]|uniref:Nif3-like dinuclear metal center hexameric protein n=1 Tax=Candidatus Acidulodesulfobacterium sp. H_13 TaxID=3395470 RepID=UPI003AF7E4D2
MPLFIKDAISKLENLIPLSLQEKWDNSGFQIKQVDALLSGVLTSLDISDKCVDLAISRSFNLILTHHPVFFHPLRSMDLDSKSGNILSILIKNNICVYSMHTNFDSSVYSMSRFMINKLGIKESSPLIPRKMKLYKLSVFIPKGYVKTVRDVLFAYGNPKIGNYENCSFETRGKGSFKPLPGSDPFIGSCMKTSFADESKLELLIDERFIKKAISEMKKVHPYEEIAYDLYPVYDFGGSSPEGMGAVGDFENGMFFSVLLDKIRALFSPIFINYCGDINRKIKRVAVVSGSGFSFMDEAVKSGSDVIISSELTHDKAIKANDSGICVIELSHFDTERYFSGIVKEMLSEELGVPVIENVYENNPFFKYKI